MDWADLQKKFIPKCELAGLVHQLFIGTYHSVVNFNYITHENNLHNPEIPGRVIRTTDILTVLPSQRRAFFPEHITHVRKQVQRRVLLDSD